MITASSSLKKNREGRILCQPIFLPTPSSPTLTQSPPPPPPPLPPPPLTTPCECDASVLTGPSLTLPFPIPFVRANLANLGSALNVDVYYENQEAEMLLLSTRLQIKNALRKKIKVTATHNQQHTRIFYRISFITQFFIRHLQTDMFQKWLSTCSQRHPPIILPHASF